MATRIRNEGIWLQRYPNETEAVILRTFKKHHIIRFAGEERVPRAYYTGRGSQRREIHTHGFNIELKVLASRKAQENGIELSPGEMKQIEDQKLQLAHILRVDDDFFREMVRVYHRRMNEVFPLGRGCDLTPAHELLMRAERAAAAGKPFEFWVLLLGALRKGYEICERCRNLPLLQAPNSRRSSPGGNSAGTTSSTSRSRDTKKTRAAAEAAQSE